MLVSKCELLYNIYLAYCLNIHIFFNDIHMFLTAIIFEKNYVCVRLKVCACLLTYMNIENI